MTRTRSEPANDRGGLAHRPAPPTPPTALKAAQSATQMLDEVESVARIGSYSTDLVRGRWTSSRGLDAIFGIDAAFDRSVDGWASLVHPDDREMMIAYLTDDVLARGQPFDKVYRIVRADSGEERWVHGRGALDFDSSGRPIAMFGTIADVTDQLRAQRNLAEAQRIAHIGSWEWDLVTGGALRSDELHRIYGVEPGTLAGTTDAFHAFIHPEDRERVIASERTAITHGDAFALDYRAIRPDGSVRIIHDEARVVRDPDGTPVRLMGTAQDITERVAADEERARLAAAVEQTSDSVIIADLAGTIEYVNPAFERISGYRRDEAVGANPRFLKSGRQSAAFYRSLWRRLAGGQTWRGTIINRRKDGSLYELEATISPLRRPGGEISGYVAVQRDVTTLREAESALAEEFRERAAVAAALARLQPRESAEETAADIADQLVGLPGIDAAAILNFANPQRVVPLAVNGPDGMPLVLGLPLTATRSAYLYQRASLGPWAEDWRRRSEDGPFATAIRRLGIQAIVYAPIANGEGLLGLVAAGTSDAAFASHMIDHLPVVGEFAATASALLSRQLESGHRDARVRSRIQRLLDKAAFGPVFQPIIALESGRTVGYEALTRFPGRRPPHEVIAEAHSVGLGAELELACLAAALGAEEGLPSGAWLSLNASPSLILAPELPRLMAGRRRPLVVEITEHAEIHDYAAIRAALTRLGPLVSLAVDDAGAGFASLRHVVELAPRFLKVDISLVRHVGTDLTRQAMIAGLSHFANRSGCQVIAEGIEAAAECAMLRELGVTLGQGFLLGKPMPVESIAAA